MFADKVLIVGAGIGGLALAAGLRRLGVPFVVLERAPKLAEVGAGLAVFSNAVKRHLRLSTKLALRLFVRFRRVITLVCWFASERSQLSSLM